MLSLTLWGENYMINCVTNGMVIRDKIVGHGVLLESGQTLFFVTSQTYFPRQVNEMQPLWGILSITTI